MREYPSLIGQRFGKLTVTGRSDRRGTRGKRTVLLWECQCDCGAITYKATDTLKNASESMCAACAQKKNSAAARQNAGYAYGTQIPKLRMGDLPSSGATGVRGVYLDPRSGKYRARLRFRRKYYNLGSYDTIEEARTARRKAEEEIFGAFLGDTK